MKVQTFEKMFFWRIFAPNPSERFFSEGFWIPNHQNDFFLKVWKVKSFKTIFSWRFSKVKSQCFSEGYKKREGAGGIQKSLSKTEPHGGTGPPMLQSVWITLMSWQLATSPPSPCLEKNNDKSKDVRLDGLAVKHILLTWELVIVAFMPTNDNFIFNI